MVYRLILPEWAKIKDNSLKRVIEGEFSAEKLIDFNNLGYNVYYLPNYPSVYNPNEIVEGSHIDVFEYLYVDMDLKEKKHSSKDEFIEFVGTIGLEPSKIVDSGNGVHVYWRVTDLDALTFLKLQRRLIRLYNTDEAVAKIYQLMRLPGTLNTKDPSELKYCQLIYESDIKYTSEEIDKFLPALTKEDEDYCNQHFDKTYKINQDNVKIDEKLPLKFVHLLRANREVKEIWAGNTEDRSAADYRLGHIMFANSFTRDEALSVLVNTAKALSRAPAHRVNYAQNIVEKVWTYELEPEKTTLTLSQSVKEILAKNKDSLKGTRFACHNYIDATDHGFRLGQVIGLVAGVGVGKTAMALNMFEGFVRSNPDYVHFFIPLEQPPNEIAERWKNLCGDNISLHDKVHVLSNYAEDGSFRHLSLVEIKEYLLKFQEVNKCKIGCVVIDHIGVLKKKNENGENQGIMDICHEMKGFAVETNTLLVMQSQSNRDKAGDGDLELNKDAAYGTIFFESYCDYLITIWQPLKKCYNEKNCPSVTAFKFCKIRHKNKLKDKIQEDTRYLLMFDPKSGRLYELTQEEEQINFDYFNKQATNKRKQDRKTDLLTYTTISWTEGNNGAVEGTDRSQPD